MSLPKVGPARGRVEQDGTAYFDDLFVATWRTSDDEVIVQSEGGDWSLTMTRAQAIALARVLVRAAKWSGFELPQMTEHVESPKAAEPA